MMALRSDYGREERMLGAVPSPGRMVCETRLVGRRWAVPNAAGRRDIVPVYQRRCRWALGLAGLDALLPVPPAPNGGTPPNFDAWLASHPELAPLACSVSGNMSAGSPEYGCVNANALRVAARTAAWAAANAQYNYQSCVRGWTISANAAGGDKAIGTRPDLAPTYCDSYLTPGGAIQTTPLVQALTPASPPPAAPAPKPVTGVPMRPPDGWVVCPPMQLQMGLCPGAKTFPPYGTYYNPAGAGGPQPGATPGVTPAPVTPVNTDSTAPAGSAPAGSGPVDTSGGFVLPASLSFLGSKVQMFGVGVPWWLLIAGGGVALYAFSSKKGRH